MKTVTITTGAPERTRTSDQRLRSASLASAPIRVLSRDTRPHRRGSLGGAKHSVRTSRDDSGCVDGHYLDTFSRAAQSCGYGALRLVVASLVLALLAAGCAPPYPCEASGPECVIADQAPDQARFVAAVWSEAYGMVAAAPPAIRWVTHGDDTCPAEPLVGSLHRGDRFNDGTGWCVFGIQRGDRIYAMAFGGDWEAGRASAAHELLHAALGERYGDADASHDRREWTTLLPSTMTRLAALGIVR